MDTPTLRQVAVPVADLDAAVAFYCEQLGLPLRARFGPLAFVDAGPVRLMITAEPGAQPCLYFGVTDIDAVRAELAAAGATFADDAPHVVFSDHDGVFGPAGQDEVMTFLSRPDGELTGLVERR